MIIIFYPFFEQKVGQHWFIPMPQVHRDYMKSTVVVNYLVHFLMMLYLMSHLIHTACLVERLINTELYIRRTLLESFFIFFEHIYCRKRITESRKRIRASLLLPLRQKPLCSFRKIYCCISLKRISFTV